MLSIFPFCHPDDTGRGSVDSHRLAVPKPLVGAKHIHLRPHVFLGPQRAQEAGRSLDRGRKGGLLQPGTTISEACQSAVTFSIYVCVSREMIKPCKHIIKREMTMFIKLIS
jgi:hypothetical protein